MAHVDRSAPRRVALGTSAGGAEADGACGAGHAARVWNRLHRAAIGASTLQQVLPVHAWLPSVKTWFKDLKLNKACMPTFKENNTQKSGI
ncbi:hypothetical protein GOBAR_DD34683 [Gossypium barbadense]|nr:hypothetical protein GOBAR_DD34683 [Gossypium barbadense]